MKYINNFRKYDYCWKQDRQGFGIRRRLKTNGKFDKWHGGVGIARGGGNWKIGIRKKVWYGWDMESLCVINGAQKFEREAAKLKRGRLLFHTIRVGMKSPTFVMLNFNWYLSLAKERHIAWIFQLSSNFLNSIAGSAKWKGKSRGKAI